MQDHVFQGIGEPLLSPHMPEVFGQVKCWNKQKNSTKFLAMNSNTGHS